MCQEGPKVPWEETAAACERLLAEARPFDDSTSSRFQEAGGIYVLTYAGSQLGGSLWQEPQARIIYLGHTSVDSLRHWQNDTGVSTVRRSLAAMLSNVLGLQPLPRTSDPADEDRFANYRLDEAGELLLTAWMKENLRLAFLPDRENEDMWYRSILDYANPMLVFTNNPNNSYGPQIKLYRLRMSEAAVQSGAI